MKNTQNNKRFFAEFITTDCGQLKVKMAKQYKNVNQHESSWKQIDARNFARFVNKSDILIK